LQIEAIKAEQLTEQHRTAWSTLQRADSALHNPSFCPGFTEAVASVRDDVEIAVLRDEGRYVGFLPFHRTRHNVGLPIGTVLTDMHGLIVDSKLEWDPLELLRECGLAAWKFDHLIATQSPFEPYIQCVEESPYMDLRHGYEAYVEDRRSSGSSSIKRAASKARKLERDVGPIRFVLNDEGDHAFDTVLDWKRQQLAEMHCVDMFQSDWVVDVLKAIRQTQTEDFAGMVSTLYAGDQLVAAQIGMRGTQVISSWIPTFNSAFQKYSPGLLMHLEMAKAAAAKGIDRIDLGRGHNQMKASLRSAAIPLALGAVDRRPLNRIICHGWYRTRDLVYASPLKGLPLRSYRRVRSWLT
jgi:CelD/BcsL family acetyltransferase involved in cellulose biosynthesis